MSRAPKGGGVVADAVPEGVGAPLGAAAPATYGGGHPAGVTRAQVGTNEEEQKQEQLLKPQMV